MITKNKIKPYLSESEIQQAIAELGKKLNNIYKDEEVFLVCVLKGASMFMTDLAKRLTMPVQMEFIRLSSYGSSTKSSGNVRTINMSLPNLNDKNVIIVEDIVDAGYTAKFMIDFFSNNYKTKSLKFCSLLNKKSKREVDINPDLYCFDVEDKFIVGYGLDYDEQYRNLPYIGYLEL